MESIKNILVGLDLSEYDSSVIQFTEFISKRFSPEKVIFINVVKDLTVPEEVLAEFPDMVNNALKERRETLKSTIDAEFGDKEYNVDIVVKEGSGLKTFLEVTDEMDIDLIIVGNKGEKTSGILTQRLGRRADTNLLVVPEKVDGLLNSTKDRRTVLLPLDFSKHSANALHLAIEIARNTSVEVDIVCQHVYQVPVGYHYSGKSYEEFAEIIKKNAEKDFNRFIREIDTSGVSIKPIYTLDRNDDLVKAIRGVASELDADGIVFAARGVTATSSLFIGSSAEKLTRLITNLPLLLVRKKGEQSDIIDFIKRI